MLRVLDPKTIPTWRKLAMSAWGPPRDPTAYGILDLDAENALAFIDKKRKESGEKITLTTLVGKCVAMGIAQHPEVNAYVSRGNIVERDTVDIFFQVSFFDDEPKNEPESEVVSTSLVTPKRKANLAGAKITAVNEKSVAEIACELRDRADAIRNKGDAETQRGAQTLAKLPQRFIGTATRLGAYLSYDLGLDLSHYGIPYDAFGSCMITNVGVFGIELGFAPLVEMSRVPIVFTVGAVRQAPSAFEGRVELRRRVSLGVAFDHRIMDGYHAGQVGKIFTALFGDPEKAGL
ncbi:MAG: 2-oxo acid dehydrogenase subunit E2 [Polyangiaceae bacterium]